MLRFYTQLLLLHLASVLCEEGHKIQERMLTCACVCGLGFTRFNQTLSAEIRELTVTLVSTTQEDAEKTIRSVCVWSSDSNQVMKNNTCCSICVCGGHMALCAKQ